VWHASVSLQHPRRGKIDNPGYLEAVAVDALAGIGGPSEWWTCPRGIGHLRVPVTPEEAKLIPPGLATSDAGDSGPRRPRTIGRHG
jgi:hypothetical protein